MNLPARLTLFPILCNFVLSCSAQKKLTSFPQPGTVSHTAKAFPTDSFMLRILHSYPAYFDTLLQSNETRNIQIIYTQIDRNEKGEPVLTDHFYNLNPSLYFYPASIVKLPTIALALQRINELNRPGLTKNSTMITDASYGGQTAVYNDPTSPDGRPTIAQYIKKILLVSDNDAFNRLYEFLGQEYINYNLHGMGYDSAQVIHRLDIFLPEDQNRATNPVSFYDSLNRRIYTKPLLKSMVPYQQRHTLLGTAHYKGDSLINEPFDFSAKNRLDLYSLHSILRSIIFPSAMPQKQRFNLTSEDYSFLRRYMGLYPRESSSPRYDTAFDDTYSNLLFYGGSGKPNPDIRIFNKEGDAYGFLTDAAYIIDVKHNVEFFLTATINCNSDGIYNDDKYDYENVGYPFLKHLGEVFYQYELNRQRTHQPDLKQFVENIK